MVFPLSNCLSVAYSQRDGVFWGSIEPAAAQRQAEGKRRRVNGDLELLAADQPAGLVSPEVFGAVLGLAAGLRLGRLCRRGIGCGRWSPGFAAASGLALAWRTTAGLAAWRWRHRPPLARRRHRASSRRRATACRGASVCPGLRCRPRPQRSAQRRCGLGRCKPRSAPTAPARLRAIRTASAAAPAGRRRGTSPCCRRRRTNC